MNNSEQQPQQQQPQQPQQQQPQQQPQQQQPQQQPQQQQPQQQQPQQQQPQQQQPQYQQPQYQQPQYQQPQYQQPQYQQQDYGYQMQPQQEDSVTKTFDYFHPCGDGSSIFLPNPILTIIARMVIKNCIWIVLGLIGIIIFIRYLIQPCYGDCKNNVLISGIVANIPIIGKPLSTAICFFACLWISWLKFMFNSLTSVLGL
jgi:hypothetical protein